MHKTCFVCGKENCSGLGISYSLDDQGNVKGEFCVTQEYQDGTQSCHRGIILTLLDSAMVHTLLQRNMSGLTVKLNASFHKKIPTGTPLEITAKIVNQNKGLYYTTACISSKDTIYATGEATFYAQRQNGSNSSIL